MLFAFLPPFWTVLVGGGAVAIPVIIHLINRRRFKIVPWAAMKFLMLAQKQTRKRMRIEQLVLLLVRMAVLALIILAMSAVMPWAEDLWGAMGLTKFGKGQNARAHRVHHVFVLDASLSMNQKVGEQTAFEVARQMIVKKIQDNPSGDGYSVLILKDSPTWLVGDASHDARRVINEIREVKPSHGNSSLPAALGMIASKLTEVGNRFPGQAVYFFTDMQYATWTAASAADRKQDGEGKEKSPYLEIQQKATTIFVDCGPMADQGNVAVTDLEFDLSQTPYVTADTDLTLRATLKNFGVDAAKEVRAEYLIGKAKEAATDPPLQMRVKDQARPTTIDAQGQTTVEFKNVRFPEPGTYALQVRINDDALPQDNSRTIIITVRKTIPVLIVNGKVSADRFERASEYFRLALNPFPVGEEPKEMPIRTKVITPGEFSDMRDGALSAYDCVCWCDVGQFGENDVRKLDAHLRRGGGFIVSLGENSLKKLDRYNDLLNKNDQGILPAKLLQKIVVTDKHQYYLTAQQNAYEFPPLKAFSAEIDRMTLQTARFSTFVEAQAAKARTVMSFGLMSEKDAKENKDLPISAPAIVEWQPPMTRAHRPAPPTLKAGQKLERTAGRYRGRVILLTTALNMDWTSAPAWPGSPSYTAMMHELLQLAVSGRLREQKNSVGDLLEAFLPGGAEIDVDIKFPTEIEGLKPQKARTQLIGDVNHVRWAETDFSGIYRFETAAGHEIPFAVNVPSGTPDKRGSESDLARINEAGLQDTYLGWKFQVVRDVLHGSLGNAPVNEQALDVPLPFGPDLANVALLMVLGLLFLEIVLAWSFGHYTTTEGALTNAAPGPGSTIAAGVIAVVFTIFAIITVGIMGHYYYTGDFLGFAPDILRHWFERMVGVEGLQAGEGSAWRYQQSAFLFGLPGNERWYQVLVALGALVIIFFTYKAEAPRVSLLFKLLLGALRLFLILFTLTFLLPRPELHYDREGFPDAVLLIDDTRSMGESDTFQDGALIKRVNDLGNTIRNKLRKEVPEKIKAIEAEIQAKEEEAGNDAELKAELDNLRGRKAYWEKQDKQLESPTWRPSRLQLVQAILLQPEPHWLKTIVGKYRSKLHVFHLDVHGRATKLRDPTGDAGEIIDIGDPKQLERAIEAIGRLEPVGDDSRLGTAVRQVIDHYRGSALSCVIMFTDGVTTRDETLSQAGEYAGQRGVPLLVVGIGDQHELRELKLHDLDVVDTIYVDDNAVFKVSLTGHGYQNLTVPVVLKYKNPKTGVEEVLKREMVKVDPNGKAVRITFSDNTQTKTAGRKPYIIQVEPPKLEPNEKPIPPANLRIERTIEVIDTEMIKVLYVEGQPRYEFRYLKFLLEREAPDQKKKKKSIELNVLLLDSDDDWHQTDKTALRNFPPTLRDLTEYNVLIIGDCDPTHRKLQNRLKDIANFANGVDENKKRLPKGGGGLLFLAGSFHNPHRYKGTPLADVLPVEPIADRPPAEVARTEWLRPELTPVGRFHQIFRFSPNDAENQAIVQRLTPMYWYANGYGIKPLAEVLAVHPRLEEVKANPRRPNQPEKHPLIVEMPTGGGRSMFFGFDETWRWRLKEDEPKYNNFWIQTIRYLSRGQIEHTKMWLDQQRPYRVGETIRVSVTFPNRRGGTDDKGPNVNDKTEVKVAVEHQPMPGKPGEPMPPTTIKLKKLDGSVNTFEATFKDTREGKFKFRLTHPDVSAAQPDGKNPFAEAIVELPPGELEKLRLDIQEISKAADASNGRYFTLMNADELLDHLPPRPVILITGNAPPTLLWNQWWAFIIVLVLITSEWILRKMKHLL